MSEVHSSKGEVVLPRIGEVVESASERFVAQCYQLYQSPSLGAFVRTDAAPRAGGEFEPSSIYAVVCGVSTQALDPGRPVVARGEEEATEEDVYRSNPQLMRLLCTRFEALIVGHSNGGAINQYLPALPPRIHAFVYLCSRDEMEGLTRSLDFLHLLVNSAPMLRGVTDEVVAACLRQSSVVHEDPRGFLVQAGKVLATQLTGDMPRLNAILRRLSP